MNINFLYQGLDPFEPAERRRIPAQRLDVQRAKLEDNKVRVNAFDLEQQALAIQVQRMRAAELANQVRGTRDERPGILGRARAALGAVLIAAGERLREETAHQRQNDTATDTARYHA